MKTLTATLILLLLVSMSNYFLGITPIAHNREIRIPIEYPTIQKALDEANPGDIIIVSKGIYHEQLVITKSDLILIGEEMAATIIESNQTGSVIEILANNVTIKGFTIKGSDNANNGIFVQSSSNITIVSNDIQDCKVGVNTYNSQNSRIIGNLIANNDDSGIILQVNSKGILIMDNNVTNNRYVGINVFAYADNNTISKNIIMNNGYCGVQLYLPRGNKVSENIIMLNDIGVRFVGSRTAYNNLSDNTIAQNKYGIEFWDNSSSRNIIYNNNIMNNTNQLHLEVPGNLSGNLWNNIVNEGNYWSDYKGEDLDRNGVGDTEIPHNGVDRYPLSNPRNPVPLLLSGQIFPITLQSDSVVAELYFNPKPKEICFKVIGQNGTYGYCNITIPKNLLSPTASQSWVVFFNDTKLNVTITENVTFFSLYFTYKHSIHNIKITVEDRSISYFEIIIIAIVLVLAMGVTLITIKRRKIRKN